MQSPNLSKAWEITVKFKILWLFGFIVTSLGSDILFGPSPEVTSMDGKRSVNQPPVPPPIIERILGPLFSGDPKLLIPLIIMALITSLVLAFLAIISEAALARGVADHEEEDQVKFSKLFSEGLNYFWRLLAVNLLLFLAYLSIAFIFFITVFSIFISPVFLVAAFPVFVLSIVAAIFLSITSNYSKRFIVLDDQGSFSAISSAVRLFLSNKNDTLKLYFTVLGIFIASSIPIGIISYMVLIPFSFIDPALSKNKIILLLLLLPIAFLIRLAGSILSVFLSSVWTMGFMSIRNTQKAVPAFNEDEGQLQDRENEEPRGNDR